MTQYTINVPAEKAAFVEQLLAMLGLEVESREEAEQPEALSPELRADIEEAMRQVREGKTITMEEFKERTASWFK